MSIMWAGLYCLWVYGLGLHYPAPFHGIISGQTGTVTIVLTSMLSFPKDFRADPRFRRCIAWMMVTILVLVALFVCHLGLCFAMQNVSEDFQWLVALLFPVIRE